MQDNTVLHVTKLMIIFRHQAMKKMSSTDTPLGTVAMMQAKQKQMQMPYVFLSGGAAKALTT